MRITAILILVLTLPATSAWAVSGTLHKCKARNGSVYYTDKGCSIKNERDKPLLDKKDKPKK